MAAEKNFENKVKKYLDSIGAVYVKYFANSFTKSGVPDLLACINGYFVAVEIKAENGKPSKLQYFYRDKIRKSYGVAIILYPENFEDFKDLVFLLLNNKIDEARLIQFEFDRK